jgi:hypothetical protein
LKNNQSIKILGEKIGRHIQCKAGTTPEERTNGAQPYAAASKHSAGT